MRRHDPESAIYWEREIWRLVVTAAGSEARFADATRKYMTRHGKMTEREARAILRRVWRLRTQIPKIEYFVPDRELGIRAVRVLSQEVLDDVIGWYDGG